MENEIRRRRGLNYLGELGSKLRDLRGTATLAHELIQNAEDAIKDLVNPSRQQTSLVFRVDQHALVVENGGVFSDCGAQDQSQCPWMTKGERPCDFHSFADVGGAAKRRANNTQGSKRGLKGAFGFGFTAVYQITDHPHLISNGRHWILEDHKPEEERILECSRPDCAYCQKEHVTGTRFVFPWAFDNLSSVRQGLNAPAVARDKPKEFVDELESALPQTVLFLDHLSELQVVWEETQRLQVSVNNRTEPVISVTTNGTTAHWAILKYDFGKEAVLLRARHPQGEKNPSSEVKLAVPKGDLDQGLFFAFLPTQDPTNTPFHLNADFFPTNDRKRILLENDYQGDWNRAAIRAGALALKGGLLSLRAHLGPAGFWGLLKKVHNAAHDKLSLIGPHFWNAISPDLPRQPVVPDQEGHWQVSSQVRLVTQDESSRFSVLHRELGILSVHRDVLDYTELLTSPSVGVRHLDSSMLATRLQVNGLSGQLTHEALPNWLQTSSHWNLLWQQVSELLKREGYTGSSNGQAHVLSHYAIVKCIDGIYRNCEATFRADPKTRMLFAGVSGKLHFADDDSVMNASIGILIPTFTVSDAIASLEPVLIQKHRDAPYVPSRISRDVAVELIAWFDSRVDKLRLSPSSIPSLKSLAICPTADGLRSFDQVVLPGGFSDPIGVTSVADTHCLQPFAQLVRVLSLNTLSLEEYVTARLPDALRQRKCDAESCYALLQMLSKHQGELYALDNSDKIRTTLRGLDIICCSDGTLRSADDGLYFPHSMIKDVLGDSVFYVNDSVCSMGIQTLLEWIGVEAKPRLDRVVDYIIANAKQSVIPTQALIGKIGSLFEHLGNRSEELQSQKLMMDKLKAAKWLPSRQLAWNAKKQEMRYCDETSWKSPNELYHYRTRHLVETIALFPDLPPKLQDAHRSTLVALGMCDRPSAASVIKHLQQACRSGIPVNARVYQSLNDAVANGEINQSQLKELNSHKCLYDSERRTFIRPKDCFSEVHPFGAYRVLLGSAELHSLTHLLPALGIRPSPSWTDAVQVIREIATSENVRSNRRISQDDKNVLRSCWKMIGVAFHDNDVPNRLVLDALEPLSDMRVVCRTDNILEKPHNMFFRDREQFASAFSSILKSELVPMPQGYANVLRVVGVRNLSDVTTVRVIHDESGCSEAVAVWTRIQERTELLSKIIEAHKATRRRLAVPAFDSLKVFQSSALTVELTFCGFEKPLPPVRHGVFAAFDSSTKTLWYCLDGAEVPWDSIAFELSRMCLDDDDVAQLSAAVNAAIEPPSLKKAQRKLSQLGFPSIELSEDVTVSPESSLSLGLGTVGLDAADQPMNLPVTNAATSSEASTRPTSSDDAAPLAAASGNDAIVNPKTAGVSGNSTYVSIDQNPKEERTDASTGAVSASSNSEERDVVPKSRGTPSALNPQLSPAIENSRFVDWLDEQGGGSERRQGKIREGSREAPRRTAEARLRMQRSHQVSRDDVFNYLRSLYSLDGVLFCQMRSEHESDLHTMPFLKRSGEMYCGKEELFNREMTQQLSSILPEDVRLYLFLCPNCAAIFTEFIATRVDEQRRLLSWLVSVETNPTFNVDCSLRNTQPNRMIHFHPKHLDDIRSVDGIYDQSNDEL